MPKSKKSSSKLSFNKIGIYIGIALLLVLAFILGTRYQRGPSNQTNTTPTTYQSEQPEKDIAFNPDQKASETNDIPATTEQGAGLEAIRYSLPGDWKGEIKDGGLWLAPLSGGGYYVIKVYDYPGDVGRREFYCSLVDSCIDSTTFEATQIGNISGYKAHGLDNSGSGQVYFGAKGNSFYIIDSYNPPAPNNFENQRQAVLDSLQF